MCSLLIVIVKKLFLMNVLPQIYSKFSQQLIPIKFIDHVGSQILPAHPVIQSYHSTLRHLLYALCFLLTLREFHQKCFDEPVNITIHHCLNIGGFEVCPVVFHQLVRLHHIRTYLRAPLNLHFCCLQFILCFHAFPQLHLIQLRLQQTDGILFVLQLRT